MARLSASVNFEPDISISHRLDAPPRSGPGILGDSRGSGEAVAAKYPEPRAATPLSPGGTPPKTSWFPQTRPPMPPRCPNARAATPSRVRYDAPGDNVAALR